MPAQSEATENYLKAVYQLSRELPDETVASGEIARRVGVAPATATLMLKRLAGSGLVRYEAYLGVSLTGKGRQLALRTVRRHRLIELFLVRTLDMPWDQVHAEAERMEHAVSDELVDRIDEYLERPEVDPHGAPIPRDDLSLPPARQAVSLAGCDVGTLFTLRQVPEQSSDFLRYLSEVGLSVGTHGKVTGNCANADVVNIRVGESDIALSRQAASCLQVSLRD